MAVFVAVALGHLVGKIRYGRFVLGGITGSLIVGMLLGQLGIHLDGSVKTVFFALFIYAIGFQGGPQFFRALNRRSLNFLLSACVTCFAGLACVLISAWIFDLDRGTAAGLAAGGLTQTSILGTAGDAVTRLDLSPELIKTLQTNIAIGYAVCFIFGNLGPIIVVSWFLPMVMNWDIRQEAIKLAKSMSGGRSELEPGQFNALGPVATRVYRVTPQSSAVDLTLKEIDRHLSNAAIEAVIRDNNALHQDDHIKIQSGDQVAITGLLSGMGTLHCYFGPEEAAPHEIQVVEEVRSIILTKSQFAGKTLEDIYHHLEVQNRHGAFLIGIRRMGRDLPPLSKLELNRGDELVFLGASADLGRVQSLIGYALPAAALTDFFFFGFGMAFGMMIGLIEFDIAGVPVSAGAGGGCLVTGLLFGWLRSTRSQFAALPSGASNFLRDFGLAFFVAVVGISVGPEAYETIQQHGFTLLFLGVGVTIIPQIITFYFSFHILRIRNPIELLGCIAGGRSANPAFTVLLEKSGNATPVVSFTLTYVVANVLLTIWGPLIIFIITQNPSP